MTALRLCLALAVSSAGCATLISDKQQNLMLVPANGQPFPDDAKVTDNGHEVVTVKVHPVASSACDPQFDQVRGRPCTEQEKWVIPPGIYAVPVSKREDHHIVVSSGGQSQAFDVGRNASVGYFFLDLFTSGPIGITVDWVTHAWCDLDTRAVKLRPWPTAAASATPGPSS